MKETEFPIDQALIAEVMRIRDQPVREGLPRHRHELSREEVVTSQRARIIVATAEVVTEVGYAAASSKAIIARAGVSSKTFYGLFDGKEAAFYAAYTLLDGIVVQAVRTPLRRSDPRQMTSEATMGFLTTLTEWPLFTRMHAVEARAAGPRVLARRTLIFAEFVRAIAAAAREARELDDRVEVPSDGVLMAAIGGISELTLQHIVERDVASLPELQPTIVELVERILYSRRPDL